MYIIWICTSYIYVYYTICTSHAYVHHIYMHTYITCISYVYHIHTYICINIRECVCIHTHIHIYTPSCQSHSSCTAVCMSLLLTVCMSLLLTLYYLLFTTHRLASLIVLVRHRDLARPRCVCAR